VRVFHPAKLRAMILIIYAHPYPSHSRANAALLNAVRDLPDVQIRSLYDLYPDFDIDVAAEQAALTAADAVVWLHPLYWYSVPAMLKHWFDVVLLRGWAYGHDAAALRAKPCLWVSTTGGDHEAYSESGSHRMLFEAFAAPIKQTAEFCQMRWQTPMVVHAARTISDEKLAEAAGEFRARLLGFAGR
jgi:glutathione-regulated potassium-efflux system ancillary protein KefF